MLPRLSLPQPAEDSVARASPVAPTLFAKAPPSVKTVAGALSRLGPMTSADLRGKTGLPRRTIYAALKALRGRGVLGERPSLRDTRQTYFWLSAGTGALAAPRLQPTP